MGRWIANYMIATDDGGMRSTTRIIEADGHADAMKQAGERGPEDVEFVVTVSEQSAEAFLGQTKAEATGKVKGIARRLKSTED